MTRIFISFEGIDGSGKSTQVYLLENFLKSKGFQVCLTREPGGTQLGESLRKILIIEEESLNLDPHVELCLMVCARVQHIQEVLLPALKEKKIVICDRFFDSTLAYQGSLGRIKSSTIIKVSELLGASYPIPNITFFLDIDPEKARLRSNDHEDDRFRKRGLSYLRKVREAYIKIMRKNPKRVFRIDASLSKEEMAQQIYGIVCADPFFLDQ